MPEEFRYQLPKPSELPKPEECPILARENVAVALNLLQDAIEAESDQPADRISPAYNLYHQAADHLREAAFRCDTAAAHQSIQWKDRIAGLGFSAAASASAGDPQER